MSLGSWARRATVLACCFPAISIGQEAGRTEARSAEPPRSRIDPATGHRVLRLTSEPGSASLYFHRPEMIENLGAEVGSLIRPGVLRTERPADMSRHQYRLEPNVAFTPDQKWIVFRSNVFGPSYVFAVEIAKTAGAAPDHH